MNCGFRRHPICGRNILIKTQRFNSCKIIIYPKGVWKSFGSYSQHCYSLLKFLICHLNYFVILVFYILWTLSFSIKWLAIALISPSQVIFSGQRPMLRYRGISLSVNFYRNRISLHPVFIFERYVCASRFAHGNCLLGEK